MTTDLTSSAIQSCPSFDPAALSIGAAANASINSTPGRSGKNSAFTVLVVDDQQVTRMRLGHLCREAGYNVETADTGRGMLEAVRDHDIDLVVTDIQMPVMDGLKAIRLLRQKYNHSELPIMVMTASENRSQVLSAFRAGANDYIHKPIDNDIMLARLYNQLLIKKTQKALKESEERYSLASQGTNDGIWDWNLLTGELYLSERWREMVGIASDATPHGNQWMDLIHAEDRPRVTALLESHLCGETEHFETELRMLDKDNGFRWMLCRGLAFRGKGDIPCRISGSLTDITAGKVADALTGLPNRVLFQDRVERSVEQLKRRPDRWFAVIYMDVDDFKLINDHLGHRVGDEFLVAVADRIQHAIRSSECFVARLGGDEFAVIIESIDSAEDAIHVANRIHRAMSVPFRVGDREIVTRASMGISLATSMLLKHDQQPLTAETLLSQADAAMYKAKKQPSKAFCVFERHMLDENAMVLEMGNELRMAISRDELTVFYQPIVDIETSKTIGFESLLRWQHPVHGSVNPADFIPIAEAKGLIGEIGQWVLQKSCEQIQRWNQTDEVELFVSVNVSIRQIAKEDFVSIVDQVLADTGIQPHLLRLEVTETVLMQNTEETIDLLNELRKTGIKISIDDFGTGFSSLSYLHKMPIDVLKIDRSFVSGMTHSSKHAAIVQTVVTLAQSLNLRVVAEGIETHQQLEALRKLGCRMGQGYLFSRPAPVAIAKNMLKKIWTSE